MPVSKIPSGLCNTNITDRSAVEPTKKNVPSSGLGALCRLAKTTGGSVYIVPDGSCPDFSAIWPDNTFHERMALQREKERMVRYAKSMTASTGIEHQAFLVKFPIFPNQVDPVTGQPKNPKRKVKYDIQYQVRQVRGLLSPDAHPISFDSSISDDHDNITLLVNGELPYQTNQVAGNIQNKINQVTGDIQNQINQVKGPVLVNANSTLPHSNLNNILTGSESTARPSEQIQNNQLANPLDSLPNKSILSIAQLPIFEELTQLSNIGEILDNLLNVNEKLKVLSEKYYGANKNAYRKSIEHMEIPPVPGYDIDDALSRLAYHRWKSNKYLQSPKMKDYQPLNLEGYTGPSNVLTTLPNGQLVFSSAGYPPPTAKNQYQYQPNTSLSRNTLKVLDLNKPIGDQCVATLEGHTGIVHQVTALLDGRPVSCSADRTVKVWDMEKPNGHQCIATLKGHTGSVNCVITLPNKLVVSGSSDNTLKVWDAEKPNGQQCVATLEGHTAAIHKMIKLSDHILVSVSSDNTIKVWNLEKPNGQQCVATLKGHSGMINAIASLPEGLFVTGSEDNTIKVWDWNKPNGHQCVATLEGHSLGINELIYLPDGRLVSISWDSTIKVWDLSESEGNQCIATLAGAAHRLSALTNLSDSRLVSNSWGHIGDLFDQPLKLWHLNEQNEERLPSTQ
ncbi:MAG: WD40 repeat domain-containing protein [Endozoicomonas sp. (ex Botrylloides leachii)]|nr:WD40 repeat domain-containing protein [Endozoicomonas sp. (ex Botrylloides leachii)]